MRLSIRKQAVTAGIAALILALPVQASINKSVKIPDGGSSNGASSVNGSVTVRSDATVTGNLSTVNGAIRIGRGSEIETASTVNGSIKVSDNVRCEDLETVNGSIKLAEQVTVDGEVSAVNGSITLDDGSSTTRHLSNVNGDITLRASQIGGNVTTVNGDVEVIEGSIVSGDLKVKKPSGFNWSGKESKKPRVIIGPGSRVDGTIILEREVKLYISESASVGGVEGVMSLDDAERFSGNRP